MEVPLMKPQSSWLALWLAVMGSIGCTERGDTVHGEAAGEADVGSPARGDAMVRVVHAIPGEGTIDVFAGESRAFSGVAFRRVTEYVRVTPNTPTFRLARAAASSVDDTLAAEMAVTRDGHAYTLVAMGGTDSGTVEVEIIRDDDEPVDSTKARLRVINAAARSGPLDIFLGDEEAPFIDDLDVRDDAGYRELAPRTVTLTVRPDDQRAVLLRIPDLVLEAGTRHTLVLARSAPRGNRLSVIRLTDESAKTVVPDRGR